MDEPMMVRTPWRGEGPHLFCEGCRDEETLSSQNFLIASVVRAWSALESRKKLL